MSNNKNNPNLQRFGGYKGKANKGKAKASPVRARPRPEPTQLPSPQARAAFGRPDTHAVPTASSPSGIIWSGGDNASFIMARVAMRRSMQKAGYGPYLEPNEYFGAEYLLPKPAMDLFYDASFVPSTIKKDSPEGIELMDSAPAIFDHDNGCVGDRPQRIPSSDIPADQLPEPRLPSLEWADTVEVTSDYARYRKRLNAVFKEMSEYVKNKRDHISKFQAAKAHFESLIGETERAHIQGYLDDDDLPGAWEYMTRRYIRVGDPEAVANVDSHIATLPSDLHHSRDLPNYLNALRELVEGRNWLTESDMSDLEYKLKVRDALDHLPPAGQKIFAKTLEDDSKLRFSSDQFIAECLHDIQEQEKREASRREKLQRVVQDAALLGLEVSKSNKRGQGKVKQEAATVEASKASAIKTEEPLVTKMPANEVPSPQDASKAPVPAAQPARANPQRGVRFEGEAQQQQQQGYNTRSRGPPPESKSAAVFAEPKKTESSPTAKFLSKSFDRLSTLITDDLWFSPVESPIASDDDAEQQKSAYMNGLQPPAQAFTARAFTRPSYHPN
jgi:hypothetical protein